MEITDILKPALKKIDVSEYTGQEDFITVRRIPTKLKSIVYGARARGIDQKKIIQKMTEMGIEITKENLTPENMIKVWSECPEVMATDIDTTFYDYKMKLIDACVDPDKHSFTSNHAPAKLDKSFFENLIDASPNMFDFIVAEIEKYQDELSLGE